MRSAENTVQKKIGRNDFCPCGSGKKYKACCLKAQAQAQPVMHFETAMKNAYQAVAKRDRVATRHWFGEALKLQPDHPQALAGMGQFLCWQEQRREGLGYLQRAARRLMEDAEQRHDIRFIMELADQLHYWGDLDTALALARQGVKIAPADPAALNHLALFLVRVNQVEEAEPYARMACMQLPDNPACNNLLAIIETRLGQWDEARARFEGIVEANRVPEQTTRALQELVGVLDHLGEYDAAFDACSRAKSMFRQIPAFKKYDPDFIFRTIARNKAGFDRALLQRWKPADFADTLPVPVFLIGFLRSGTTLTEQVLAAYPEVFSSDENSLIHGLVQQLRQLTGTEDVATGLRKIGLTTARELRALYWRRVREEYGAEALNKRFVDKVALNSIDVGLISTLFPEAKILFALRDPRDVCLSCYQQAFQPSNVTVNLSSWDGVAKQYAAVMDYWLSVREHIAPAYVEIRYEDTVADLEASMRRVLALMGLEWVPEVAAFHERARGRYIATPSFADVSQPIYQRSVARWRRYERHYQPILPVLVPYIEAFGYRD